MKIKFLLWLLFSTVLSQAQPVQQDQYKKPVKVACIGNSITYGAGIKNRPLDSYPAQLGRMLGNHWKVRNFGISGRTLLNHGDYPYRNEEAFTEVRAFQPDVVVIMLGTNDTKPQNWKYADEFLPDYRQLIEDFLQLPSHPKIYLCKPVPAFAVQWGINDSILVQGVIPAVEQLAGEYHLPVIDLYAALQGKGSLFPDHIHPNPEGAGLMALTIYKALTGKERRGVPAKYPGKQSEWHGFSRYDFQLDRRDCHIIVPEKAAAGTPWVWRARFPEWHYQMDSILLSNGFHIAYINTDKMFGSPKAMAVWDNFYTYLVSNYHFNSKAALEGVSRGGLFVYSFAKKYPGRVSCIYTEAPVCDIKSWPAGTGFSEGDPASWKELQSAYGFRSEKEALAWADNPFQNLDSLAKANVPVFHSISLTDSIVPPEENTFILINRYVRLGGPVTIYPNTRGQQNLKGHHFPIDDIQAGANFILHSYQAPKVLLQSSNYHNYRSRLKNSQIVFERTKQGRVAFLGGSITYNPGWRDSICAYLQNRFPDTKFEFIAAGIPSMGSTPGAFRLERDVLSHGKIDLLFEEAAVNDRTNGRTGDEQLRGMEGIVRHARKVNPATDIVLMHFVDPEKMEDYRKGKIPDEIKNYERIADQYQLPTINLAREVTDRISQGEFSWEKDFKNVHPSPFGQHVYSRSMKIFLENCWSGFVAEDDKITAYPLPEKLTDCYDRGKLIPAAGIHAPAGWQVVQDWQPEKKAETRPDFVHVPMLTATQPGKILKFSFSGNAVGIAVASGPDAGTIAFRIDQSPWQEKDLYTSWSSWLYLPWFYTLGAGLQEGTHQLEIRTVNVKNPQSTGHACIIRYFYINE